MTLISPAIFIRLLTRGPIWGLYRDFQGQKSHYRRIALPATIMRLNPSTALGIEQILCIWIQNLSANKAIIGYGTGICTGALNDFGPLKC